MPTRRSLVPLLALLAAACEGGGSFAYYDVRIVDPSGAFPVDDGTITVTVTQDGQALECDDGPCTAAIRDGAFMGLELPLPSFDAMTEIAVEMSDGTERWIGATPPFQLHGEGIDFTATARVVVARPSSCEVLTLDGFSSRDRPMLDPPRANAAAVVRRNLVLLAGGEKTDGSADDHVTRFDQLLIDTDPLPTWNEPEDIGAARGLTISEDVSLVIGDRGSFVFKRDPNGPPRADSLALHEGAGFASAVVPLPVGGAVIGGQATRGISWISAYGAADRSRRLAIERTAPVAARLGEGILVVGGHREGEPAAEWLTISGDGEPRDIPSLPAASGGVLFPSPDGAAALWIGYEQAGVTSADTFVIRCAERECTAEPGPITWDRARSDFASVITAAGTLWLIGGEASAADDPSPVDIVRWVGGVPQIEAGPDLPANNRGAVAFEHAAGIVTIAGGRDIAGQLVMCFPSELESR